MEHIPQVKDVTEVRELVSDVNAKVAGLSAQMSGLRDLMKPMQRTLDMVNDYLLNKKS